MDIGNAYRAMPFFLLLMDVRSAVLKYHISRSVQEERSSFSDRKKTDSRLLRGPPPLRDRPIPWGRPVSAETDAPAYGTVERQAVGEQSGRVYGTVRPLPPSFVRGSINDEIVRRHMMAARAGAGQSRATGCSARSNSYAPSAPGPLALT